MAARLWWLLKWLGHDRVAVLDGGYTHWKMNGFPTSNETPEPTAKEFFPNLRQEMLILVEEVEEIIYSKAKVLIDSRAEERYRGEVEPIDPVAGHIPGAVNHFYMHNVDDLGKFKSAPEIKKLFLPMIGKSHPDDVVFYCGSGVTGAHNVLAYFHSGLGMPKLYAGSWSEWITNPEHLIARKEKEKK